MNDHEVRKLVVLDSRNSNVGEFSGVAAGDSLVIQNADVEFRSLSCQQRSPI